MLSLEMTISNPYQKTVSRTSDSRINTALSKEINRFLVMCIMQYAFSIGSSSKEVYERMQRTGLLDELEDNYEDLHGMSTVYLNDYIGSRLGDECQNRHRYSQ